MQYKNKKIFYSPSDLITFLESPFASFMERSFLEDKSNSKYLDPEDKILLNLKQKSQDLENEILSSLSSSGKSILKIQNQKAENMISETTEGMINGFDVIAQAYLELGGFSGIAGFFN